MKRIQDKIHLIMFGIEKVFKYAGTLSEVAMVFIGGLVCVSVIMRYVINEPFHWNLEVSCWLYVFMVFIGMAELMRNGQHITIDIFYVRFSKKAQSMVSLLIFVVSLFWCLLMDWQAWKMTLTAYKYGLTTSSLLRFPMFIAYSFLAVGLTLLTLSIVLLFVKKYYSQNNIRNDLQKTNAEESATTVI